MICLTLTGQNGPLVCILDVFAVRLMRVPRYYLVSWSDTPRLYNRLPFWDTFLCYEGLSSRFALSLSPPAPSCLANVGHNLGNCQDPHVLRLEPSFPVPSALQGARGTWALAVTPQRDGTSLAHSSQAPGNPLLWPGLCRDGCDGGKHVLLRLGSQSGHEQDLEGSWCSELPQLRGPRTSKDSGAWGMAFKLVCKTGGHPACGTRSKRCRVPTGSLCFSFRTCPCRPASRPVVQLPFTPGSFWVTVHDLSCQGDASGMIGLRRARTRRLLGGRQQPELGTKPQCGSKPGSASC